MDQMTRIIISATLRLMRCAVSAIEQYVAVTIYGHLMACSPAFAVGFVLEGAVLDLSQTTTIPLASCVSNPLALIACCLLQLYWFHFEH